LTLTLIHGGEKLGWTIGLLLESLQHILKMYTWSMSENQVSIQFRCKIIGLVWGWAIALHGRVLVPLVVDEL
jgi:hypothetical protein